MSAHYLLIASLVAATRGMTLISTVNSGSQISIGNHNINVVTEPFFKVYVDGRELNMSTAGVVQSGQGFTLYTDFPGLPGFTIKTYDQGGYSIFYENNGVVSRFGSLTEEEERELNRSLAQTFDNVNRQISQVQQQVGNMMQSLNNMFSQPGWPFVR